MKTYHVTHTVKWVCVTHPFNCPLSGTTRVSRYQKGKTNLDFTVERDSVWQWHQLGRMQVFTLAPRQMTTPATHRRTCLYIHRGLTVM